MINHKPPMLGRTKVLGKAKRGEVRPTKVQLPSQPNPKPIQHHGGDIYMVKGLSYEHGNLGEIQYIWVNENEG